MINSCQNLSPQERARAHLQSAVEAKSARIAEAVDPLLRDWEGAALLGVSVPTWWRRVKDGTVPKPIKLGGMSRWPQSEIIEVIERAKAARDAA